MGQQQAQNSQQGSSLEQQAGQEMKSQDGFGQSGQATQEGKQGAQSQSGQQAGQGQGQGQQGQGQQGQGQQGPGQGQGQGQGQSVQGQGQSGQGQGQGQPNGSNQGSGRGGGMGGRGQGSTGRVPTLAPKAHRTIDTMVKGQKDPRGKQFVIPYRGLPDKADSKAGYYDVATAAKQQAEGALSKEEYPVQMKQQVRDYFEQLQGGKR
jgi:hypothetical protein